MRGFDHATILSPSFHGIRKKRLTQSPPFCILKTTENALQITSVAAYASETNNHSIHFSLGTYRNFVRSLIKPPVLPSIVDEHNRVDIIENFRLTLSNYYFFRITVEYVKLTLHPLPDGASSGTQQ